MSNQLSWRRPRRAERVRPVLQADVVECGIACLTMVASGFGVEVDLPTMRRRYPPSMRGTSLLEVANAAVDLGLRPRALQANPGDLAQAIAPAILHWEMNHFVVLLAVENDNFLIADPAVGRRRVTTGELSSKFTGVALTFERATLAGSRARRQVVRLRDVVGPVRQMLRTAATVFGLALAAELMGLLLPFQMRWVVDRVLVNDDAMLLWAIGCALALMVVGQTLLNVLKGRLLSYLGVSFNAQWSVRLFTHLLRLPMVYFERRHMGDIVSRFMSAKLVQTTLTSSFIQVLLDGAVGLMALVLMATLFSASMTWLVLLAILVYTIARSVSIRSMWLHTESALAYNARQQSEMIESLRGMQTIKLSGAEVRRGFRFDGLVWQAAQQEFEVQKVTTFFTALSQGLFAFSRLAVVTMGGVFCLRRELTAGALVAFVAYADQLIVRVTALLDRFVDYRMLNLHAERVADIALEPEEQLSGGTRMGVLDPPGVRVENLSFRYGLNDPFVLRDVSMQIGAGESVAIVGPSGRGKTTLVKLLLGLLEPTSGEILIGDTPLRQLDARAYRKLVATVMQDDHLFAGSLAANVALFDDGATPECIVEACRAACLEEDIMNLPMGYETLVGDMGSCLSGGQKQRLLLARALYRKPSILVLDEATSHLDESRERQINTNITAMNITRIIIAHRESTIRSADRVIEL
jgi:ATP-binding cassette, subfamily B, bacterial CvaB/MchF/RaxB